MSSSINLNLTGVGEEIAVAVAEAMRKQLATFQCQTAGIIAQQVSQQFAAAIKTTVLDSQKPTFDVREQILGTCLLDLPVLQSLLTVLANANFILKCYRRAPGYGTVFDDGIAIVVANCGELIQASVVATEAVRTGSTGSDPVPCLLSATPAVSSMHALQNLFACSREALARVWKLRGTYDGFTDLGAIYFTS